MRRTFALASLLTLAAGSPARASADTTCSGEGTHDVGKPARVALQADALYAYAEKTFGKALSCQVEYDTVDDATFFPAVTIQFKGASLRSSTTPGQFTRLELTAQSGFPDSEAVRKALVASVKGKKLDINWKKEELTRNTSAGLVTQKFHGAGASGDSLSADLLVKGKQVIRVGYQIAL